MPVIVIGADTRVGEAVLEALLEPDREIRAFVTDADTASRFKSWGVKVATGDLSDVSHVSAAATRCFSAVLIGEAAADGRPFAFASRPEQVLAGWAEAVSPARVQRSIWVVSGEPPTARVPESVTVGAGMDIHTIASRVVELDDAATLS